MNKKIPLVLAAVVLAFAAGTMLSSPITSTAAGDAVLFRGGVICACKNSEVCYEGMPGASCEHNTIVSGGKNATRAYLAYGGTLAAFNYLALSNGSAPAAGDYNLSTELTVSGLTRTTATVTSNPSDGNWSLVKTWTAGGQALNVNIVGILNQSSMGPMLAGGTFTSVNLEANDQLTINYTLWIGSS